MDRDERSGSVTGLSRAGAIAAGIFWAGLGLWNASWWLGYSRDAGSGIFVLLALLVGAAAAYSLGRAIDARRQRAGALWLGRALALAGAAVAVAFPSVLYGEMVMLAQQGRSAGYDIEAALWHEVSVLPLGILPALVALRGGRVGGLLLLLLTAYGVADSIYHFDGVNYFPQARTDLVTRIIVNAPAVATAVLLFVGSHRWGAEEGIGLPRVLLPAAR